ncbi:hypothetical protein SO802_000040 [Lithocarpus litseifolius]|uniref:NYN domain-containing protein n=1 Tax=Lithocarpus litseifolius TaxID=425828 RepID=A0AAW2DRE6_9ROSI
MKPVSFPSSYGGDGLSCFTKASSYKVIQMASSKKQQQPKGSEPTPLRITSNVKQNLQFLKLWKEFQKKKSSTPKPATSYRKKKVQKEDLPEDTELYRDPAMTLYYTNQGIETAVPVLLVDGYNVCGYWMKLKKHFLNGRLDIARQKLVDELITYSMLRGFVDIVYSGESCADAWIEKEVAALKEDGCPKVWVVTSDNKQQHAAHGAGAFVWSCKALVSEIKASQREVEMMLQEQRSSSFQGKLLKHNLDSEVVDALKDLRRKLSENESKTQSSRSGR